MLILNSCWFAFIDDSDKTYDPNVTVYEVGMTYKGVTDKGFEFEVRAEKYSNIPYVEGLIISRKYRSSVGGGFHSREQYRVIYLSQNEVEEMYKDACDFFIKYIKNSSTCYVQTIKSGGAGSEYN